MDVGNAGYAWSYYLPRRRRKYVHGRSRLPASHGTYTSMYVVGLNVASMPHTLLTQTPDIKNLRINLKYAE